MKLPKFLLLLFMLTFSFIYCEDRRKLFAENIKNSILSLNKPQDTKELIDSFDNSLTVLCYTLALKEIDEIQFKFGLSDSIVSQIKAAQYSKGSVKRIKETTKKNLNFGIEETTGAAINENDGKISFALIKTQSFAKLKIKMELYYERECHRVWLLFKKCENVKRYKTKVLTPYEITLIEKAVEYSLSNLLLKGAGILERDDYELYMTSPGSIFSPDVGSVAHFTYFGDIAIGPSNEIDAVLPIDFRCKLDDKRSCRDLSGYTKMDDYPRTQLGQYSDIYLNNGLLNEFYFKLNNSMSRFPRNYVNYFEEKSKKGPYILEVKKNGNVIFYEEKTNKIIWTTNTANKGTGPYNFYLSNNRELILEDSNKNIIYNFDVRDFSDYIVPSIFYAKHKYDIHRYNGRILEFGNQKFKPTDLDIYVNNNKVKVNYEIKIQETGNWHEYNGTVYDPELDEGLYHINGFSATLSYDEDFYGRFSICYTLRQYEGHWTPVGRDGDRFEMNKGEHGEDFFSKIIIFVSGNGLGEEVSIDGVSLEEYMLSIK